MTAQSMFLSSDDTYAGRAVTLHKQLRNGYPAAFSYLIRGFKNIARFIAYSKHKIQVLSRTKIIDKKPSLDAVLQNLDYNVTLNFC